MLKIDPGDILDKSGNDRLNVLDRSSGVAFPGKRLNVRAEVGETVNRDFSHPCKVLVRRCVGCKAFYPLEYPLTFFFIAANLQSGSFSGLNA